MAQPIFLVDAFSSGPGTGNPAGVCPLDGPAPEQWMQMVAAEMNQAETAFFWPEESHLRLRWLTPVAEVDLCGHATLAAAHILYDRMGAMGDITFETLSGPLRVNQAAGGLAMDFPAEGPGPTAASSIIPDIFGENLRWFGANRMDWFAVLDSEAALLDFVPDSTKIARLGMRGLIVTARADRAGVDFVSRFFAPAFGVPEDPVTGSAHCALGPYWANELGKSELVGFQASRRGGRVSIKVAGDRVQLSGSATTTLEGQLLLEKVEAL